MHRQTRNACFFFSSSSSSFFYSAFSYHSLYYSMLHRNVTTFKGTAISSLTDLYLPARLDNHSPDMAWPIWQMKTRGRPGLPRGSLWPGIPLCAACLPFRLANKWEQFPPGEIKNKSTRRQDQAGNHPCIWLAFIYIYISFICEIRLH